MGAVLRAVFSYWCWIGVERDEEDMTHLKTLSNPKQYFPQRLRDVEYDFFKEYAVFAESL